MKIHEQKQEQEQGEVRWFPLVVQQFCLVGARSGRIGRMAVRWCGRSCSAKMVGQFCRNSGHSEHKSVDSAEVLLKLQQMLLLKLKDKVFVVLSP